jgi:hypothetical protein
MEGLKNIIAVRRSTAVRETTKPAGETICG